MTGAWKAMVRRWILLPVLLGPVSCDAGSYGALRSIATPATQVAAPWMTGRWVYLDTDRQRAPGDWDFEVWAWHDTADLTVWGRAEDETGTARTEKRTAHKARLVQLKRLQLLELVVAPELMPGHPLGEPGSGGYALLHVWFRLSGSRDSVVLQLLKDDFMSSRLERKQNRLPHTTLDDGTTVLTGDVPQLRTFLEEAFAQANTPPDSFGARVETLTYVRAVPGPTVSDTRAVGR